MAIGGTNVGRIAERIAMNELEARGFHIIDLAYMSKTSANVDFIASRDGVSCNIQVKGASSPTGRVWGVQYGYCDEELIHNRERRFFNRKDFALEAHLVILLSVNTPSAYRSIILPIEIAEKIAQINMDKYHRKPKADGGQRKPSRLYCNFAGVKSRVTDPYSIQERELLLEYEDAWEPLGVPLARGTILSE